MKKILCATDGTSHGEKAVAFAARMASLENVPLAICTVNVMSGGIRSPAAYAHSDREISKLLTDAVAMAQSIGAKDVSANELDAREVAQSIVAYANREGFDHIVTGTGDPRLDGNLLASYDGRFSRWVGDGGALIPEIST